MQGQRAGRAHRACASGCADIHVPGATVVIAVFRRAGSTRWKSPRQCAMLLPDHPSGAARLGGLVPIYDRSQTIVNSVNDVQTTLYIAFVLVVLVIFIFLGRATDTLIPAVALPLSLLLTFMAMNVLGYSLDNLSLMALTLAIGFLVDDAIVFLENTVRLMEDGPERPRGHAAIGQGNQLHDSGHDAFRWPRYSSRWCS